MFPPTPLRKHTGKPKDDYFGGFPSLLWLLLICLILLLWLLRLCWTFVVREWFCFEEYSRLCPKGVLWVYWVP